MKPIHTTLLLGTIFAGLGLYLYFIEAPAIDQEVAQEIIRKRIVNFDDRDIINLAITTPTESLVLTRDLMYRWHIVQPVQERADSRSVQNLLRPLTIGQVVRIIDTPNNQLDQYGLNPPYLSLALETPSQTDTILLGDIESLSSGLYAKRESDGAVLLTTLSVENFRGKNLSTFRKKEIFPFDRLRVEKFTLDQGSKHYVLTRTPSPHGNLGNWKFESPIKGPADKTAVNVLLMALEDLKATGFIDPGSEYDSLNQRLSHPTATITVFSGNRERSLHLFHVDSGSGDSFARRPHSKPIYQIDPVIFQQLPKELFSLQDRRLFGMEAEDLALLIVKHGDEEHVLIHQHQEWMLEEQPERPLDRQAIDLFLSRVVNIPAELRIETDERNQSRYGLTSPTTIITGIDRKGRKRGFLALGYRTSGLVYAKGAGLPGIYQARSTILNQIPSKKELLRRGGLKQD